VINNAGNQRNALFEDLTDDMIDAVLETHLKGAYYVTQPAWREMKKQGYGRILLVGSQSAMFGNPCRGNYAAAKGAMVGMMNVLAQEGKAHGIVVNLLLPNAIVARSGAKPEGERPDAAFLAEAAQHVGVFQQAMRPEFVAPMAAYLVSEACQTSQGMYSVLGNRYARAFVGLPDGWLAPLDAPPTVEDIQQHLAEIEETTSFIRPLSGVDEMKSVADRVRDLGRSTS
jgi:NAD(P)-dependent dehydrogenase (short-subunit alcohol dehydrogenase family)